MRQRLARLLLLLAACLPAAAAAAEDALEARVWSSPDNTRLVIESGTRLPYSVSDLDSPPRLLIDIATPTAADAINRLAPAATDYIAALRAARHDPRTLRIVFDLAAGIHYRVHRIAPIGNYRHRLVIDIAPQTPPADPLLALLMQLEQEQQQGGGKPFLVLIDPGHGGEDPGAVSPNNRYEKNLVLQISKKLIGEINRRPGMKALLTRDHDRFIPLFERVHIAHRLEVDAFVSVHADSVKNRKARGSSVFILSQKGASTKFARRLAQRANLSDLIGGQPTVRDPLLTSALRQFSQDGKDRASRRLAALMLENLGRINKLHSKRVESAGFAVLKSPSIPSVLVETAFISNPVEEKKLLDQKFQQQLAVALADALESYKQQHHVAQ